MRNLMFLIMNANGLDHKPAYSRGHNKLRQIDNFTS